MYKIALFGDQNLKLEGAFLGEDMHANVTHTSGVAGGIVKNGIVLLRMSSSQEKPHEGPPCIGGVR